MQPTRTNDFTPVAEVLVVSLELASKAWKLAVSDGRRSNPAIKTVSDSDAMKRLDHCVDEVEKIRTKWELPAGIRTAVVFEAGQDGFWIARALKERGYEVKVCDAASIPVPRQARRAKTDRLDALLLLQALQAWLRGERQSMRVIQIPTADDEAERHLARERGAIQAEIGRHRDRIGKLLRTVGCWLEDGCDIGKCVAEKTLRCADGTPLPSQLQERLERECERMALAQGQFKAVGQAIIAQLPAAKQERIAALQRLKGIGQVGAVRLVLELFWRRFQTRQQVGSCVGLVPQPYNSGNSKIDQGISKQGNRRVRSLLIELAWFWLRYQPGSELSRWFARRTGGDANKRGKRIAIVAVARKLAIALWRYLEYGVVPKGAALKPNIA